MLLIPKIDEWTIVIAGNWNVSIFNPDWLTKYVFEDDQLKIEVPLTYGLPPRIKGDNILLLPSNEKIILGLTKNDAAQKNKLTEVSANIIRLLHHTPIYKIGINFGFKVTDIEAKLYDHFPFPDKDAFSDSGLILKSKQHNLRFEFDDVLLNTIFTFQGTVLNIKFNYEITFENPDDAINKTTSKYNRLEEKTIQLLNTIFEFEMDEGQHE